MFSTVLLPLYFRGKSPCFPLYRIHGVPTGSYEMARVGCSDKLVLLIGRKKDLFRTLRKKVKLRLVFGQTDSDW